MLPHFKFPVTVVKLAISIWNEYQILTCGKGKLVTKISTNTSQTKLAENTAVFTQNLFMNTTDWAANWKKADSYVTKIAKQIFDHSKCMNKC